MASETPGLIRVWDDTVELRALLIGVAAGPACGLGAFGLALWGFGQMDGGLTPLTKGYALLIGVMGCVVLGAIVARIVRPQRIFHDAGTPESGAVLAELGLDIEAERRALESAPPQVIEEMRRLGVLHLFEGAPASKAKR